jgi:hypothetical protein
VEITWREYGDYWGNKRGRLRIDLSLHTLGGR